MCASSARSAASCRAQVPRNVHLSANAIWDAAALDDRAQVREWARGLLDHDGELLR
jgi:hypothetical protein